MIVRRLQGLLERLYDVESQCDIADYLVTDRNELHGLEPDNDPRCNEEQLLLAQTADGAGVSLFIDDPVLRRLEAQDPMRALTERNLPDYCTALEGVSHFLYATWRLGQDTPLSLLELETQAEVDKFALSVFLLTSQDSGRYPGYVFARLFDAARFDSRLDEEQLSRYSAAHRSAARYCRFLEKRFVRRGQARVEGLLRELRKFYRLGSAAKLDYALAAS